jgi:hypothetical protein
MPGALLGRNGPARPSAAAALDHPVSPVPGIGPAGLESSFSAWLQFVHSARGISTSQPISLSESAAICGPVCLQRLRAHAALSHPPGYTGGCLSSKALSSWGRGQAGRRRPDSELPFLLEAQFQLMVVD